MSEKIAPLWAMLASSNLVYYYASIRALVNKHDGVMTRDIAAKEKDDEIVAFDTPSLVVTKDADIKTRHLQTSEIKHPVTPDSFLLFLEKNRHLINNDMELRPKAHRSKSPDEFEPLEIEGLLKEMNDKFDKEIWEFDDVFADKELVFSVVVNRTKKRIVCVFRGSVDASDWLANIKFRRTDGDHIPELDFAGDIGLHRGFTNYLFKDEATVDGQPSKFNQIVDILKEMMAMDQFKDYEIFVTGHSLGGALSQLLSFGLAGSPLTEDLPKPITAITFASPLVGNHEWLKAYQKLEKEGKLRHIRVSNNGDHVCCQPAIPFMGYTQTGVNIHLFANKKADVGYRHTRSSFSAFEFSGPLSMHSLTTYLDRLLGNEENLDFMDNTVEEFYEEFAGDCSA